MLRALMAVAIMAAMVGFARGRNFVVGAPTGGWDRSTNYTLWASTKTFYPGDTLTFLYGSSHDVLEVTSAAYGSCGAPSNPISSDKSGNTTVALKAVGTRYFICGTAGHCRSGMKMAVSIASSGSPSLSPLPDFPPDGPADPPSPPFPPLSPSPPAPTGAAGGTSVHDKVAAHLRIGISMMTTMMVVVAAAL
ncbi:hypothetical protein OPV22_015072 [Ensete ventricosum]|uniref:Phytocyanin domain-containing protein n=1 Tax=Ensete ventricosum TaxID=4639 RepID=A0AAV8RDB0_ENSVE|nr:hypothetical protein OPV22_015072 [Ensete ventricosum]